MNWDLVDAAYVAVELLAEELAGFGVGEEIACEESGSVSYCK
jgi:hypothetical protein